jgi:hypothetical protein
MEEILKELKEELRSCELIDNETNFHYNLLTTDQCFEICKKYLSKQLILLQNG